MGQSGLGKRLQVGVLQCVGLGLCAGGMESVHLATSLTLPLGWGQSVMLGLVAVLVMGCMGALIGGLTSIVHPVLRAMEAATAVAWQVTLATFVLTGWYLWQGAWWTATDGAQPIGAAAMAAMPIGFAGVAFYNARFLLRRAERVAPIPWIVVSGAVALALVGIASLLSGSASQGHRHLALEGDDNLLIVTIDGLRHDGIDASTPVLSELASSSIRFVNAVTPVPDPRAANATLLTGLHPLRHKVLSSDQRLTRSYRTIFEVVEREGWITGGFVSDSAVGAGSGLEQGLLTFDDDMGGLIPGSSRINVVGHLTRWLGPAQRFRLASGTAERFAGWVARQGGLPWGAWVHLSDPRRAVVEGTSSEDARAEVDAGMRIVLQALAEAGVEERTLVVVAGSHGLLLGEHGGSANETLYDPVVRIPFLVRAPGQDVLRSEIDAQVRLMDVANTTLEWLQLDRMASSEGIGLLEYATGKRTKTIWCPLVGQDIDGDWLIGLRNNGVKYVRHPDGREELYDVSEDPQELRDLSAEQTVILEQARSLLGTEAIAFRTLTEP